MKFQSSLREVMLFIKYSKDKENLSRVLAANERRFREVERRAADVIEAITNSGIKYDEEDEVVNVCHEIQTFGFHGTYKLLLYPNFFKETALFKCSA